jgi:hypothetical protein
MKEKFRHFYGKYERYLSPITLVCGFVWDNLTLRRVDLWAENIVLISYLLVAGASIAVINARGAEKIKNRFLNKSSVFAPYFLQFAFGGLFSAFTVFYFRSASFVTSWPFLLFLAFLLVGNEIFRKKYERFFFHTCVFFAAIFLYFVFAVPLVLNEVGVLPFLLSGFFGMDAIIIFIFFIFFISDELLAEGYKKIIAGVLGILFFLNALYFLNLIPPIPLSLSEAEVCHSVVKNNGNYVVSFEPRESRLLWEKRAVFHWKRGSPVYFFSSVFAPAKIDTKIFHRWFFYDEEKREWVKESEIGFAISGGRDAGFRGYTMKNGVWPGKWRVDVVTQKGQSLGRMVFDIVEFEGETEIIKEIK